MRVNVFQDVFFCKDVSIPPNFRFRPGEGFRIQGPG